MRRAAWLAVALLAGGLGGGCVERRLTLVTNVPGAAVYRNGQPLPSGTPVDVPFTYYGDYEFTFVQDGFQTKTVCQPVPAPWWQYPPFDFITEVLYPGTLRDHRVFAYDLEPIVPVRHEDIYERGWQLKGRGATVGSPAPVPPPAAGP